MNVKRIIALASSLGVIAVVLPVPAVGLTVPETLAEPTHVGALMGRSGVTTSSFPIDYLGISWSSGGEPRVRFRNATWTRWRTVHEDDGPTNGRTFSRLIAADGADAYQLSGANRGVQAVAINTTDGPRTPMAIIPTAEASHVGQPAVIPRSAWGADESCRFNSDGSEKWSPVFYPTQKLVVHHTAGQNDDPDPAATIRAIYRYHAIDRGWGDIGYNFLIDAQGRVYKGRYSGPPATWYEDTLTGENPEGHGVTGAHTAGSNSGTMGIAVLGNYISAPVSSSARRSLVDHLAWEAERHGLDPMATSPYTNPVNGAQRTVPNISGHRDWVATKCPGERFYADLPAIRQDVANRVSAPPDTEEPNAPTNLTARPRGRKIRLQWGASTDEGSGVAGYEVWKATASSRRFAKVATRTATSFKDTRIRKKKMYRYYVVAFDAAGNRSAPSNKVTAKVR